MKVGIFTFPNSTSYGAELQMYALYEYVRRLGHTPEVINYHNAYMKAQKHMSGRGTLKAAAGQLLHHRLYRNFRRFEKDAMVRYPQKSFSDPALLPEMAKRYDAVICGSDQVWNPDITGGDLSYFLNFCGEDTRRVAYAPSFGVEALSSEFAARVRPELERFFFLSVREKVGQTLIRELTGREAALVVDPTLLLRYNDWANLEREHPLAQGDYILYYTIRSSRTLWKKARELSEKTGMKLVAVGGNFLKTAFGKEANIEYAVDIGPDQWLYLMRHARYVVTNSFHGTVFSIIFRRDFYVEFSSLTNSRMAQITQALGLTDRIVGEAPLEPTAVDYSVRNQVLPQMRKISAFYLQSALKERRKER